LGHGTIVVVKLTLPEGGNGDAAGAIGTPRGPRQKVQSAFLKRDSRKGGDAHRAFQDRMGSYERGGRKA